MANPMKVIAHEPHHSIVKSQLLGIAMEFNSKDELREFLGCEDLLGLDSEYSYRYKEIVQAYSAKGLDVNRWWVFTPTDWRCPSCSRSKVEILRLNKHGYLTGHLHEHHDHVADYLEKEFRAVSESKEIVLADLMCQRFVTRTAFSLSAYDSTVICSDCNGADAKAKSIVSAPKEFSFSPAEIKRFVVSVKNKEHEIDSSIAFQVWEECKETFFLRMRLVKYFAELAASNTHWYQPSKETAKQILRKAEGLITSYGLRALNTANPESLLYKSNKFKGNSDSWRMNKRVARVVPPTQSELQHMLNMDSSHWDRTPENWLCPICRRSKFECVRKSNKGRWIFRISTSKVFFSNSEPKNRQFIMVCNDCSSCATHLGSEMEKIAGVKIVRPSAVLMPNELAGIIQITPHSKHIINNSMVESILTEARSRIELVHDEF